MSRRSATREAFTCILDETIAACTTFGPQKFAPSPRRSAAARLRLTQIKLQQRAEPRTESSDEDVLQQLRSEFLELRTVAAIAVDLLFDVAPRRLLRELDPDLLEALMAVGGRE